MNFGAGKNILSDVMQANTIAQGGGMQNQGFLDKLLGGVEQAGQYVADNPNFQRALAQMGAEVDPQGVGGVVGRAAIGMQESSSQQEFLKNMLKQLGKGGKVKQGADGTMEITKGEDGEVKSDLSEDKINTSPSQDSGIMSDEDVNNWLNDFMGGM